MDESQTWRPRHKDDVAFLVGLVFLVSAIASCHLAFVGHYSFYSSALVISQSVHHHSKSSSGNNSSFLSCSEALVPSILRFLYYYSRSVLTS